MALIKFCNTINANNGTCGKGHARIGDLQSGLNWTSDRELRVFVCLFFCLVFMIYRNKLFGMVLRGMMKMGRFTFRVYSLRRNVVYLLLKYIVYCVISTILNKYVHLLLVTIIRLSSPILKINKVPFLLSIPKNTNVTIQISENKEKIRQKCGPILAKWVSTPL
jgi:hypothetical protein